MSTILVSYEVPDEETLSAGEGMLGAEEEILSLSVSCETPIKEGIRVEEGVLGVDKEESALIASCVGRIEGILAHTILAKHKVKNLSSVDHLPT